MLDTNCLVSALVFARNPLGWLRRSWQAGHVTPVLDRSTTAELSRVLQYPKFRLTADERATLLSELLPYAETADPADIRPDLPAIADPDDAKFLALAYWAGTDALVTGDGDLLAIRYDVAFTAIVTPGELGQWLDRA